MMKWALGGAQWRAATQSEAGEQRGDSPRPDHIPPTLNKVLQPSLFISIFIRLGVSVMVKQLPLIIFALLFFSSLSQQHEK